MITVNTYIVRCFNLILHGNEARETPSDEELVRLHREGDCGAYEKLYARYLGLITSLVKKYKRATPYPDFADFMQEGMLSLLRAVESFNDDGGMSFKNYLALICSNRFKSMLRSSNTQSRVPSDNMISIDDETEDVFDSTQSTVPEMVESKEYIRSLYKLLRERLSPFEYKVVELYLCGYSYKECADILEVSVKSVENALSRTRKKLS